MVDHAGYPLGLQDTAAARPIHPFALRVMHRLNVVAIVTLISSGWEIYDASPFLPFTFPGWMTIGGWIGGTIAWHLAAIWLLMLNGVTYLSWGCATGHLRRRILAVTPYGVLHDTWAAMRFRLPHQIGVYNSVQRLLYFGVIAVGIIAVLTGFAVWKPVPLWPLSGLFRGFFISRVIHFIAMTAIVEFILVHVLLVALVPWVVPPMITGGRLRRLFDDIARSRPPKAAWPSACTRCSCDPDTLRHQ